MEYRVRELLEKFLKAYMSERDLKKTLEFVSDEIISIGTGVQETAGCKFCSNGTPILKLAVHSFWFSGTRFLLKTVRFSFIIVM